MDTRGGDGLVEEFGLKWVVKEMCRYCGGGGRGGGCGGRGCSDEEVAVQRRGGGSEEPH